MALAVKSTDERPFRVPGYAGYIPGLKYSFGHTYGFVESQLFESQRLRKRGRNVKVSEASAKERLNACTEKNSVESKVLQTEVSIENNSVQPKVLQTEACNENNRVQPKVLQTEVCNENNSVQPKELQMDDSHIQWKNNEPVEAIDLPSNQTESWIKDAERERLRSVATQWSDQEERKINSTIQWNFTNPKTIPGYTGHLPGRHYSNPGQTFCREMDTLLANFHPKSEAVVPMSRHIFTSALQQETAKNNSNDPYFDNRPPSTYMNNYPIPGYQGFVPHVRTSASSLGIRYIKAVENSLNSLQNLKQRKNMNEENNNSPQKLLDSRPLHTPRHRPHPKQEQPDENDWTIALKRPPSTYQDLYKMYIPGYKGFIPHLRCSPNTVGVRYSKAALRCFEAASQKSNSSLNRKKQNSDKDLDCDHTVQEESLKNKDHQNKTSSAEHQVKYFENKQISTNINDPIPGYQGFIPRLKDSPATLGLRYSKAALKSLEGIHRNQIQQNTS